MAVRLAGGLSAPAEATEEVKAWANSYQSAVEQERKVEFDAFMPLSFCTQVFLHTPKPFSCIYHKTRRELPLNNDHKEFLANNNPWPCAGCCRHKLFRKS